MFYLENEAHELVPVDDIMEWSRGMPADRHVAYTELGYDIVVSTVFLGIDHRFIGEGPPLLYETMVFVEELADEMERYPTRAAAEAGHARMVARVQANIEAAEV